MKFSKFFLGLALALFAVIGAYATVSNFKVVTAYYEDASNNCVDTDITFQCSVSTVPGCTETINGVSEQLYATKIQVGPELFECDDPYKRP